jgi:hypothetical protein
LECEIVAGALGSDMVIGGGMSSDESEGIRVFAVRDGDFEGEFVVDSVGNAGGTVWVRGLDVRGVGEGGRC